MRFVDLFCGAGGMALGFHAAGFTLAVAVDVDERCGETIEENFKKLQPRNPPLVLSGPEKGDVSRLDLESLGRQIEPDILIGGPPCQGFSRVGRAKLNSLSEEGFAGDPRNQLYERFLEAADCWKPMAVVMENVPGMLSVKGSNLAEAAAADLAALGYEVGYAVLNAVWYGVPQFRERFFMIGIRDDLGVRPEMPVPTHRATLPGGYRQPREHTTAPLGFLKHDELAVQLSAAARPAVTVREAIGDLPPLRDHLLFKVRPARGDFRQTRRLRSSPLSSFARLMRSWPALGEVDSVEDHAIRCTPRDYETFKRMHPGDRYPQAYAIMQKRLEEELQAHGTSRPQLGTSLYRRIEKSVVAPYPVDDFPDRWRKLIPDAPSWTLPAHLAKDTYSHIHYDAEQGRSISVREAARLQAFPDGFSFSGNMGDCFRQIGNAVPPLLAQAIAHSLKLRLKRRCADTDP